MTSVRRLKLIDQDCALAAYETVVFIWPARLITRRYARAFGWPRLRRLTLTYAIACLAVGEVVVTALLAQHAAAIIRLLPSSHTRHSQSGTVV